MTDQLQRVCVKLYAAEPDIPDDTFVPIFHEWIRDRTLEGVLIDVADYTHAPDSPGVMLITLDAAFSLDRSDGRFGLLVQRRRPVDGDTSDAIAAALRQALAVADRLEAHTRVGGRLAFDRTSVRIEANDRLTAPNSESGFNALHPLAKAGVGKVFPAASVHVARIVTDLRDRLAVEAAVSQSA